MSRLSTMRIVALTGQMTNWQLFGPAGNNRYSIFSLPTHQHSRQPLSRFSRSMSAIFVLFTLLGLPSAGLSQGVPLPEMLTAVVHIRATIPPTARTAQFLGTERQASGVVIDAKGLVLTIGYIIIEAVEVEVTGSNGQVVSAQIIGHDYETGFGLLRTAQPLGVPPMPLGLSAELKERAEVLVASYGASEAVLPTFVIGRREFTGYWEYLLENAIFTSPPHPNFAGAALIGPDGSLLGIGSLFVGDALRGEPRLPGNMFIPIDRLKPILPDLLATGHSAKPPRPWLGLFTEEVGGHLFIAATIPDGPSAQAGLKPGDIIVGVGDKTVSGQAEFYRAVWAQGEAGVDIPLRILRASQIQTLSVRSLDRDQYFQQNQAPGAPRRSTPPHPDIAQSIRWPTLPPSNLWVRSKQKNTGEGGISYAQLSIIYP